MANISAIKQNIYYNQRQIEIYENEIVRLRKDIARLEEIFRVLLQRIRQLDETQHQNLAKVARISALEINKRITSPYCAGMKKSLSGKDYQSAHEGLNAAVRETDNKIFELKEELRQKQFQIDNLHSIISNLRNELYYAMDE